jgi:hypothetical protein
LHTRRQWHLLLRKEPKEMMHAINYLLGIFFFERENLRIILKAKYSTPLETSRRDNCPTVKAKGPQEKEKLQIGPWRSSSSTDTMAAAPPQGEDNARPDQLAQQEPELLHRRQAALRVDLELRHRRSF